MTPELTALALAGLLQAIQFIAFAIPANRDLTPAYALSARDKPSSRPLAPLTGRLQRAMNNHFEGLILFTLAVTVVTLGNQSTQITAACGWVYLCARVLYIPAYFYGWRPWRSIIWAAGFFATLTMIIAALI
jgi:uncharacterized MAPEG superfamily protein